MILIKKEATCYSNIVVLQYFFSALMYMYQIKDKW